MSVSATSIQTYLNAFDSYRTKLESLSTNNVSDLDTAEAFFVNLGWTPLRIMAVEQKLVYGWLGWKEREQMRIDCENAAILLVERFDDMNTTFQDFWTVVFHNRQKKGLMNIIQWNGNNPSVTRPISELKFAP